MADAAVATNGAMQDDSSLDSATEAIAASVNGGAEAKPQPTTSEITESIQDLLKTADLTSLTSKIVRRSLVDKFGCDFTERKDEINKILMECMESKQKEIENRKRKSSPSSSKEGTPPPKKPKEASDDSDTSVNDSPPSKKNQLSNDEEIARDLLLSEQARPRRAAAPKPKPIFTKKKKADNGDAPKKRNVRAGRKMNCSPELQAFLGCESLPRHEIVKFVWSYLKAHPELQDKKNKQFYIVDEKLAPIFKCKKFRAFGMMKHISKHMYDLHEIADEPSTSKKAAKKKQEASSESEEEQGSEDEDEGDQDKDGSDDD